jgi:hypothetical protein
MTTLTFAPASLSFGNVTTGDATSQSVAVQNSGTQAVTLSVTGTAFTLSPSSPSVPAAASGTSGSVVLSVTFSPTQVQSYGETLQGADGSACNLSGTGVASASLADPNQYLSESSTVATASDKYFEIAVPDFTLTGSSGSGSSFMRLGVFPSLTDTAAFSPGFVNSLRLANLVGDAALIQTVEGTGPNQDSVPEVPGSFSDGSGLLSSNGFGGEGDPDYLLGFADDTRQRGDPGNSFSMAPQTITGGQTVANTPANRQAETLDLLTKGGWWDHSDGNRVTTTVGDKVEIVQGNYKLVVLGRQPLPVDASGQFAPRTSKGDTNYANLVDNAFITDVSGGHFQEQYPSPTPCIKTIEYSQDGSGEWTLYQDNTVGQVITKLKGRTVDLFQGASRDTCVGADPNVSTNPSDAQQWMASTTLDPVITSKTWAQRIMTYVGSAEKPVPEIFTLTFADFIQDIKFATDDVLNSTSATSVLNLTTAGLVGNLNLAPVTLELIAGLKLTTGVQNARIWGINISVDNSRTKIAADAVEAEAEKASVLAAKTQLVGIANRVATAINRVYADETVVGSSSTTMTLADTNLSEFIVQGL